MSGIICILILVILIFNLWFHVEHSKKINKRLLEIITLLGYEQTQPARIDKWKYFLRKARGFSREQIDVIMESEPKENI